MQVGHGGRLQLFPPKAVFDPGGYAPGRRSSTGILRQPQGLRPVGSFENSPAIDRWGSKGARFAGRPVGTVERRRSVFARPCGTSREPSRVPVPQQWTAGLFSRVPPGRRTWITWRASTPGRPGGPKVAPGFLGNSRTLPTTRGRGPAR